MDKYNLMLDIVEHPEKYTSKQLSEIMSDLETKEIYNLLCKADSAIEAEKDIDVDSEWAYFAQKHSVRSRHRHFWFGNRAASIAAIACISIMAVAAGMAVTVAVKDHNPEPVAVKAAITAPVVADSTDALTAMSDTVRVDLTPIMFENETLERIMQEVSEVYGVEVKFNDCDVALLNLYYKFDPSLPLEEVVEQLNTFEQINIKHTGNVLTID